MDDLKSVGDDSDGHELLSVVSAVHHERVDESLDDWHLGLAELLVGVSASSVRGVDGVAEGDVVLEGDVLDFDLVGIPLSEELDRANLWGGDGGDVLWHTNSSHVVCGQRG